MESLSAMGQSSRSQLGQTIHVLVWNVFKCKKKHWAHDFSALSRHQDLILLQESVLNSPHDRLFNDSGQHEWVMARSFKYNHSQLETGVKTGCSALSTHQQCWSSEHGEPFMNTKKMLLATQYDLEQHGETLLVINAHMINFVSFMKFRHQVDQLDEAMKHHSGPIILAGDFNTWNSRRLRYFNALACSFGLHEVPMERKPRINHLYQHLDHVYYRGLKQNKVEVLSSVKSSDHYPIRLEFNHHVH